MFQIKFWGVRGTIPCAGKEYMTYGGDTSCVSIQADDHLIIFDAGSGIFQLGKWVQQQKIQRASLFLSHTHFDHIIGLPFFAPLWDKKFKLDIYAGIFSPADGIKDFFQQYLNHPLFPGPLSKMAAAELSFYDIMVGTNFQLNPSIKIKTLALNHPGDSTGYRIEYKGKSICYLTDIEHKIGKHDEEVLSFIQDTHCLIYDAMYTSQEHPQKIGWGHSTWEEAAYLANQAKVKTLFTFHHNPDHTDNIMNDIEAKLQQQCNVAQVARQGMVFTL